jgi:hypothetical protein
VEITDFRLEHVRVIKAKDGDGSAFVEFGFDYEADVSTIPPGGNRNVVYEAQRRQPIKGHGFIGADVFFKFDRNDPGKVSVDAFAFDLPAIVVGASGEQCPVF